MEKLVGTASVRTNHVPYLWLFTLRAHGRHVTVMAYSWAMKTNCKQIWHVKRLCGPYRQTSQPLVCLWHYKKMLNVRKAGTVRKQC